MKFDENLVGINEISEKEENEEINVIKNELTKEK